MRRAELPENEAALFGVSSGHVESVPVAIGTLLSRGGFLVRRHAQLSPEIQDAAAAHVLARADALDATNPKTALALREWIEPWAVPAVDAWALRELERGSVRAGAIVALLGRRASLLERFPDRLRELTGAGGMRQGLAAVLLGVARLEQRILAGEDLEAQRALLAAARLVREPLPVRAVATLFGRAEPLDAAVEAWLVSDDSAEARAAVRSHRPNEYLVLGFGGTWEWEDQVVRAFRRSKDDEVIALAAAGMMEPSGVLEIHIRGNRATLVAEGGKRTLSPALLGELRLDLAAAGADDLGPIETGTSDGIVYEYLHLTRAGGRRVVMNHPQSMPDSPHAELVRRLMALVE